MTDRGDPGEMSEPTSASKGNAPLLPNRFRSTIHLTLMTAAVYLVYLLQGICISNYFGTSAELDGFWLAMLVVTTLVALAEPFKEAAVVGVKVQELSDPEESQRTFSGLLNRLILWSLAIIAAAALAARPLATFLAPDAADRAPRAEVFQLTLFLLPLCLLQATGILIEGYLSVQRKYLVPRFYTLIGVLAAVAVIVQFHHRLAVMAIVLAFYVQFGVKLAGMIWSLQRGGFRYSLTLGSHGTGGRFVPLLLVQLSAMFMLFLLQKFISAAASGGLSAYNFAYAVWVVPLMLLASSVATVTWTDMLEAGHLDVGRLWGEFDFIARLTVAAMFAFSLLFFFLADPIVRFIYERGAFTAASVGLTADCLRVLAFGLPFWGLLSLSVRGLLARRKQMAILCIGIAQNVIIALSILLARRFSARIETLLIPYVGFNIVGSIALTRALFAGGGGAYFRRLAGGLARITMAVIVVAVGFGLCQRSLPRATELGTPGRLAYLGLAGIGLLLAYIVILWLVGEKDLLDYLLRKALPARADRN
jgi:peptidoglycan biosynthesis protein MviN/MurJ (putative lipid II flippase)